MIITDQIMLKLKYNYIASDQVNWLAIADNILLAIIAIY